MSPATDEDEAWWPPTLVPSGFGRVLLAWWTMSALSQRTRFIDRLSVAMGASAMSSYLAGGGTGPGRRHVTVEVAAALSAAGDGGCS